MKHCILLASAVGLLLGCDPAPADDPKTSPRSQPVADDGAESRTRSFSDQTLVLETLYENDFETGDDLEGWRIEGTDEVRVEDGRLVVDAREGERPYATLWCPRRFEGDILIEYVVASGGGRHNLNFFVYGSEPDGSSVLASSGSRTGRYGEYKKQRNYIVTFLDEEGRGRMRLRRNPGFELLEEQYLAPIEPGRDYRMAIAVQGPRVRVYVEGRKTVDHLEAGETGPRSGHHAFRTWRTLLAADVLRVSRIVETDEDPDRDR